MTMVKDFKLSVRIDERMADQLDEIRESIKTETMLEPTDSDLIRLAIATLHRDKCLEVLE